MRLVRMIALLYVNNWEDIVKKRIKQIIDSNGKSTFIPQKRTFGIWWNYYRMIAPMCDVIIEFDDFKECKEWLLYDHNSVEVIHDV